MNAKSTFKKLAMASAIALATTSAQALVIDAQFSTAPLGGTDTFMFDNINLTTVGTSTLTIRDTSGNGILDPIGTSTDTFVETGLVSAINFKLDGINIVGTPGTGLNSRYELFAVFTPPQGGPLAGLAGTTATGAVGFFTAPTNAAIFYDTSVNGTFDLGSSTQIAQFNLSPTLGGNCELPAFGQAQGSCVLNFDFASNGGINGVFTSGGNKLAGSGVIARVDFNVDKLATPFSPIFPGGPGSDQVRQLSSSGSLEFIPEPGVAGLLGIGLLALGAVRRRRTR